MQTDEKETECDKQLEYAAEMNDETSIENAKPALEELEAPP